jgi:hypothetical protein
MSKFFRLSHIALALSLPAGAALAHVPYLEQDDYSDAAPFVVEDVTNSKSIHAALDEVVDYDVFSITIDEPTRIYTTTNIPYCPQYESFAVTYALVGPGLPAPAEALPIELPAGYGAVIVRDSFDSTDDRPLFFEPFGGRMMWEGPVYAIDDAPPGTYRMIVWHDKGELGDYIAVIGEAERFGPKEIAQVRKVSPLLKAGQNLRVDCNPQVSEGQPFTAGGQVPPR